MPRRYDLESRTQLFGHDIILICRKINIDIINKRIVDQLIRSATSIGANYMEANGASSPKDFRNKIHLCKKESKETEHWLSMLAVASPAHTESVNLLKKEAHELTLIFSKITGTMNYITNSKMKIKN